LSAGLHASKIIPGWARDKSTLTCIFSCVQQHDAYDNQPALGPPTRPCCRIPLSITAGNIPRSTRPGLSSLSSHISTDTTATVRASPRALVRGSGFLNRENDSIIQIPGFSLNRFLCARWPPFPGGDCTARQTHHRAPGKSRPRKNVPASFRDDELGWCPGDRPPMQKARWPN